MPYMDFFEQIYTCTCSKHMPYMDFFERKYIIIYISKYFKRDNSLKHPQTKFWGKINSYLEACLSHRIVLNILTGKRNGTSKIYDKLLRREIKVTAVKIYTSTLGYIPGKYNRHIKRLKIW